MLVKPEGLTDDYWNSLTLEHQRMVASVPMPTQAQVDDAVTRDYAAEGEAWLAKKRRDRIAEGFAFSLVQHYEINDHLTPNEERAQICRAAVYLADALIAELDA